MNGYKENVDVFHMDGTRLGFRDNSFSLVFSEGLLEHFPNFYEFASEMVRVSKRYILIVQPNHQSLYGALMDGLSRFLRDNVRELDYAIEEFVNVYKSLNCTLVMRKNTPLKEMAVLLFEKNAD